MLQGNTPNWGWGGVRWEHLVFLSKTKNSISHFFFVEADVKLMDVKLSELGAWLSRRNMKPGAILGEASRQMSLYLHHYYTPLFESLVRKVMRAFLIMQLFKCLVQYVGPAHQHFHWDTEVAHYHW